METFGESFHHFQRSMCFPLAAETHERVTRSRAGGGRKLIGPVLNLSDGSLRGISAHRAFGIFNGDSGNEGFLSSSGPLLEPSR